eukprot:g5054.t1
MDGENVSEEEGKSRTQTSLVSDGMPAAALATLPLPDWVSQTKKDLMESEQWRELVKLVFSSVQKKLDSNQIQFFSDLSSEEQSLFIDEVERSLTNDGTYRAFQSTLSRSIDETLSEKVDSSMLENGSTALAKSDMVLELAAEGATALLRKLPSEKATLRLMLNHDLPGPLRVTAWSMFLGHPTAREAYARGIAASRMTTISAKDSLITEKCGTILDTHFATLGPAGTGRSGRSLLSLMKTVLSYYHTLLTDDLPAEVYYLAIPVVYVYSQSYMTSSVESTVEGFLALLDMPRPKFMLKISGQLRAVLRKHDSDLVDHICRISDVSGAGQQGTSTEEKYLSALLEQPVMRLFVGTLSLECCCYVWDQCLMVGSFERLVPNYAVAMLIAQRELLLAAKSPQELAKIVESQSKAIRMRKLQGIAERLWMGQLRRDLGISRDSDTDLYANPNPMEDWSSGVAGLDATLDWETFAMGSPQKKFSNHQRRNEKESNAASTVSLQNASTIDGNSTISSAAETRKMFEDHLGQSWSEREMAEKERMRQLRAEAVKRAEEDLELSEAEREERAKIQRLAESHALTERKKSLQAMRAEKERDRRVREAKEQLEAENRLVKQRKEEERQLRIRQKQQEEAEKMMQQQAQQKNGPLQTPTTGAVADEKKIVPRPEYLGDPSAATMRLKLKRSDGTEHKLAIQALVPGDSMESANIRVKYALEVEEISLDKVPKLVKALLAFSKEKNKDFDPKTMPKKGNKPPTVSKSAPGKSPAKIQREPSTPKRKKSGMFGAPKFTLEIKNAKGKLRRAQLKPLKGKDKRAVAEKRINQGIKALKLGRDDEDPAPHVERLIQFSIEQGWVDTEAPKPQPSETSAEMTPEMLLGPPKAGSEYDVVFTEKGSLGMALASHATRPKWTIAQALQPGGAAEKTGKITAGDVILCIGGDMTENVGIDKVKKLFLTLPKPITIRFRKDDQAGAAVSAMQDKKEEKKVEKKDEMSKAEKKEENTYEIEFDASKSFGIGLGEGSDNGVIVSSISENADNPDIGKIKSGDFITAIGGSSLKGLSHKDALKVIGAEKKKVAGKTIKLTFLSSSSATSESSGDPDTVKKDPEALHDDAVINAALSVMQGLRLIAIGSAEDQQRLKAAIEEEDKGMEEDFKNAMKKFGLPTNLTHEQISSGEGVSDADKKAIQKVGIAKIEKEQAKIYKERMKK